MFLIPDPHSVWSEMVSVELLQAATLTYGPCQNENISCTKPPTEAFPVTQSVTLVIQFYAPQVGRFKPLIGQKALRKSRGIALLYF
jgi:hypothetical protein